MDLAKRVVFFGSKLIIGFIPEKGCCCQKIGFIQVVLEDTFGEERRPFGGDTEEERNFVSNLTDPEHGGMVDMLPSEDDMIYNAHYDEDGDSFVSDSENLVLGSCDGRKMAKATDGVSTPWRRYVGVVNRKEVWSFTAETCAICLDTQEILGCITWGHEIGNVEGGIRLTGGKAGDVSLTPTEAFTSAVSHANTLDAIVHKVSGPDRENCDCGGSSAISGEQ